MTAEQAADIVVIGAGPAGLSAATAAANSGARVVLLDDQEMPGGQIYRAIEQASETRKKILGKDYAAGAGIVEAFRASTAVHVGGADIWDVTGEREVHYLRDGRSHSLSAARVVLCTGAMERPFPIQGWTLPGVMTAGAAQIMLKSAALIPREPVTIAGCGPLLYLLAWQYLRAGAKIQAIIDTAESVHALKLLPQAMSAIRGWRYFAKGIKLMHKIRKHRTPWFQGATDLRIEGRECAEGLSFSHRGMRHTVPSRLVLLHQGVVPNTLISMGIGARHIWDETQLCWRPEADSSGRLSIDGFYIAGDGSGIGGAEVAAIGGHMAGVAAAFDLGFVDRTRYEKALSSSQRVLRVHAGARALIDAMYRPPAHTRVPASDDVLVCRCEEVTAGDVRHAVRLGCSGPNQVKSFYRCGMGACQGRQCSLTVTDLIAMERQCSPEEVGYLRARAPYKPINLAQLSAKP